MDRIGSALWFADIKHMNQTDKAGRPYICHPVYVANHLNTESEKIVALLHDILEDTNTTEQDLKEIKVSKEELEAIKLLTHPNGEPYMNYIRRIAENDLARKVKIQDLKHNMDLSRLPEVTEKDLRRLEKYKKALSILEEKENNMKEENE